MASAATGLLLDSVIRSTSGIMAQNLQSRFESRVQRFAWVEEARLCNGVVLGVEFECDGVANRGSDVSRVVVQGTIVADNDFMVNWRGSRGGG